MRPSYSDLIQGFIYTWENEICPSIAELDQKQLMRAVFAGDALLKLLATSWEGEGEHLYTENKELKEGLRDAESSLKEAGLGHVVNDLGTQLAKEYYPRDGYPALNALRQENYDLKAALENVLVLIANVKKPECSLQDTRGNLIKIMKRQIDRYLYWKKIFSEGFAKRHLVKIETAKQ